MDKAFARYAAEVAVLADAEGTREETYYPAIRSLLKSILDSQGLPYDVRATVGAERAGGGIDVPDIALYDSGGEFLAASGEVKLPTVELADMASSTDRNDQIGRYLARTRVVLLCNIRGFGLVVSKPGAPPGPIAPEHRRLEQEVELWPSASAMKQGRAITAEAAAHLADLVETAATRFAAIAEPESLARILARQARLAKQGLPKQFSAAVQDLLDDFGKALGITFEGHEGEEFFRSSLIQTAYYALFAGWALWHRSGAKGGFRWGDLSQYLRIPFLGKLFHEFRHPDRIRELDLAKHLDIATETLARVDTERFFARFHLAGLRPRPAEAESHPTGSAITYFYEPFLEAFDPELRKELGVWYTPPEIVRYQVRKVDALLRAELGCERGLADPRVVVLDPCCGTGAYLIEALQCIAAQLTEEGIRASLGAELLDAACKRVLGFEILTAPFVVAQLQAYLLLSELGAAPGPEHRPAVFLTNALTGWAPGGDQLKLHFPELQQEHDAAHRVKRDARIIVILGNPPYNRFIGAPVEEESDLVDHYKGIRRDKKGKQVGKSALWERFGVRKHLLDDLYVRFFRLAERQIGERAEHGIVSFISNSSYLVGRSHPLMRESLLQRFSKVWIDNLHGNRLASERTPWGDSCETIFNVEGGGPGIKVGTAISTFLKKKEEGDGSGIATIAYRDFWGRASDKRAALLDSLDLKQWPKKKRAEAEATPAGPRAYVESRPSLADTYRFAPAVEGSGFEDWPALDDLFPRSFQGVNPNRGLDGSVIDTVREALERRMKDYFDSIPFDELRSNHPALVEDRARYDPKATRDTLRKKTRFDSKKLVPYLLFPLDTRWIYYETEAKLLNERRPELWDNLAENLFLMGVPQSRRASEARPLMAGCLFDLHLHDRGSAAFSAFVTPEQKVYSAGHERRHANLAEPVWFAFKKHWSLKGDLTGEAAGKLVLKLFHLALAMGHAPAYHADHQEALAQDWLHLPIPRDRTRLDETAELGAVVATLLDPQRDATRAIREVLGGEAKALGVLSVREADHVADSELLVEHSFYGAAAGAWRDRAPAEDEPHRTCWGEVTGDLHIGPKVYFRHVPQRVWEFELGGYPVLKKWLGYREAKRRGNRPLTLDEANHFRSMIQRLAALLALQEQLDAAYAAVIEDCFTRQDLGLS